MGVGWKRTRNILAKAISTFIVCLLAITIYVQNDNCNDILAYGERISDGKILFNQTVHPGEKVPGAFLLEDGDQVSMGIMDQRNGQFFIKQFKVKSVGPEDTIILGVKPGPWCEEVEASL